MRIVPVPGGGLNKFRALLLTVPFDLGLHNPAANPPDVTFALPRRGTVFCLAPRGAAFRLPGRGTVWTLPPK